MQVERHSQRCCCLIAGTINIIYGIGALDNANIFVNDKRFILDDLNTLGWVLIILGVIQLSGGISLMAGNTYGRVIGVAGAALGAIGALLSIGGSDPWWSLAVFALCVYVLQGILVTDEVKRLGDHAGVIRVTADGATVEVAAKAEDTGLLLGPYRKPAGPTAPASEGISLN